MTALTAERRLVHVGHAAIARSAYNHKIDEGRYDEASSSRKKYTTDRGTPRSAIADEPLTQPRPASSTSADSSAEVPFVARRRQDDDSRF